MRAWRDRRYLVVPRRRGRVPYLGPKSSPGDVQIEKHTFAPDQFTSARVEVEITSTDRRLRRRRRGAALALLGLGGALSLGLWVFSPGVALFAALITAVFSLATATSWMRLSAHKIEGDFVWIRGYPGHHLDALEDFSEVQARAAGALSPPKGED
ncbi:MAG: hypothetical protein AAFZ18_13415 [Myxococcota bacterium]